MKKVREILYEKFDKDSDPIRDLGVGGVVFGDQFHEIYFVPERQLYHKWLNFINQYKGKWICGRFNFYEKGKYDAVSKTAEVKMNRIVTNEDGILNLETEIGTYCILAEEKYTIKD